MTWRKITRRGSRVAPEMYASLNPAGEITLNRTASELTGNPDAYQVFFDEVNQRVGLKPAAADDDDAFPSKLRNDDSRRIHANRLMVQSEIKLKFTLEFRNIEIDPDGVLILDLRTAKINQRSLDWGARRQTTTNSSKEY